MLYTSGEAAYKLWHMRHRAVALRQHGFLVTVVVAVVKERHMLSAKLNRFPDYPSLCPAEGCYTISGNNASFLTQIPTVHLSMVHG